MADLNTYASAITSFTKDFSDNVYAFVTAMAAVGVLSMAIIQTVKDLFPLRNKYQRHFLRRWLAKKREAGGARAEVAAAESDLIRLATAGDDKAFYDIPIEQMCGQMGAAMQVVLDYPGKHGDLLRLMAALADPEDVERLIATAPPAPGAQRAQEEVDARTRVTHHIQRAIDGFQIAAGYRWKLFLQIAAFVMSFAVTVLAVSVHGNTSPGAGEIPGILLVGLVGGFLAPIARDLLASLQKLR